MERVKYSLILFLTVFKAFGQDLKQTVRGTVLDAESKTPLVGVQMVIVFACGWCFHHTSTVLVFFKTLHWRKRPACAITKWSSLF